MKPSRSSLDRVLHLARGANSRETEEESSGLPPGLATRIAAQWAASHPGFRPAVLWERLSYAGLAVAIAVSVAAGALHHKPEPVDFGNDDSVIPDLLNAEIASEPSA